MKIYEVRETKKNVYRKKRKFVPEAEDVICTLILVVIVGYVVLRSIF